MYSILFLRFPLSAIEECVVYSQFAYSRNMLWRQGNVAAVGNALRGLKNKPIKRLLFPFFGVVMEWPQSFSDPMNRHLAKNLSPDCSFRWSLCVQSQTEVESQGSQNYSRDMHYICDTTIFTQVLDLNDPKLVQAIWKPEVPNQNCQEKRFCKICVLPKYWFLGVLHKYFFLGVLPKCKGGRVPVCDRSKSSTQHQTPRTDSLYAQVSI